jgi:hypothetical protein
MKSLTQTSAPTWLHTTSVFGATASHSLSDPHSSDSKVIQGDMPQLGQLDELRHGFSNFCEHTSKSGMK